MQFRVLLCTLLTLILTEQHSTPSHAAVTPQGGNSYQQQIVRTTYAKIIPKRFQTHHKMDVALIGDEAMEAYIHDAETHEGADEGDGEIEGVYENDPPKITLRYSLASDNLPMIFIHEYAHYIWCRLMSNADRARYTKLYNEQFKKHQLVTKYAETSAVEGFAETFTFYISLRPVLKQRDPKSYRFFSHLKA